MFILTTVYTNEDKVPLIAMTSSEQEAINYLSSTVGDEIFSVTCVQVGIMFAPMTVELIGYGSDRQVEKRVIQNLN